MNEPKHTRFLRDKAGRIFLSCAQLRNRSGFYPVPDPEPFLEAGTVGGVTLDEEGKVSSPNHPSQINQTPRTEPAGPDPEMTPTPEASPGAQLYDPNRQEVDDEPDLTAEGAKAGSDKVDPAAEEGWE